MPAYHPRPLDTSRAVLSEAVEEVTESLARHLHDVWSQARFAEGWRFGPRRDDARKEHPCLVPYEELPESEKAYDRNAALGTVRALLTLGYRLDPPSPPPPSVPSAPIEDCRARAERFLAQGEPLLAYDVLADGVDPRSRDVGLRQLLALALLRSGAVESALRVLEELRLEGHRDEETLGLLARALKDLWRSTADPGARSRRLREARDAYLEAYRATAGYWTGVNAATLSLLVGERDLAVQLAGDVRIRCLALLSDVGAQDPERYWVLATLGETSLLRGAWAEAEDSYTEAAAVGRGRWADLSSTRRNARVILSHLGVDAGWIERLLKIPRVAVFSEQPVYRPDLEASVQKAIRDRIARLEVGFGYASAACSTGLLFLEMLLAARGEVHVVLPYDASEVRKATIGVAPSGWGDRFAHVLAAASEVVTASPYPLDPGTAHEYASRMLFGMAAIRADQLDTELVPLVVRDGPPGDADVGTASGIGRRCGPVLAVEVIDLRVLASGSDTAPEATADPTPSTPADRRLDGEFVPRIMALLFADAVNFSKLDEDQTRRFVEHFLGRIAALAQSVGHRPVMSNTWGDGLYFVFETIRDAGLFALDLSDCVRNTDWPVFGLPSSLSLRIGLHAGPVYACRDPLTGFASYVGTHVSRAARIEPIVPPGEVYASQAFAALARAEYVNEFSCEYVGLTRLAKGHGSLPTFHVRRAVGR